MPYFLEVNGLFSEIVTSKKGECGTSYVVNVMRERTATILHFLRRGQLTACVGSSSPSKVTILRIFESVKIKSLILSTAANKNVIARE